MNTMNSNKMRNRTMNKKGQLTIFIIIGIVLLFSTALILYIKNAVTEYKPPVEVAFEQVPTELQPLQKYISDCIADVAAEGIRKAGLQGGYIDSSKIAVNPRDPTSGEGILFSPGSTVKVPYWYYMSSPNDCSINCEFDTKQPPLRRGGTIGNSVEEQLDKYVEERISFCVGTFSTFKDQFTIEQGTVDAVTTIAATDLFVQTTFPITVKFGDGRVETLSKFTNKVPVNFGKFYDLASDLSKKEIESTYLHHFTINLISIYGGLGEGSLPPMADASFDPAGTQLWFQRDVRSKIEELLMIHAPALQTTGSLNFQGNLYSGTDRLTTGLYDFFILPMNKSYRANVEFSYLAWWPSYLLVTPNAGEIIRPDSASGFDSVLSTLGINQYRFAYDVSYPILVTLTDPDAFNGQGFTFQFALEENTRNNAPIKGDTALISASSRSTGTLVCNPANFNSGEITIDVSNSITDAAVENALVYFSFGKEACLIGKTTMRDGKAILKSKMPVGIGSLLISHDSYLSKTVQFSTALDESQDVSVSLDPYVDLEVSISRLPIVKSTSVEIREEGARQVATGTYFKIHGEERDFIKTNTGWSIVQPEQSGLDEKQQAIISFTRIQENPAQQEYVTAFEINGEMNETPIVRLVPGTYNIDASLFDNQLTIIPADEACYPDDWYDNFGLGEEKCDEIPAVSMTTFPKGGVTIRSFVITEDMLKGKSKIHLTLFSAPDGYFRDAVTGITDMKHDDISKAGEVSKYSSSYSSLVEPVFT